MKILHKILILIYNKSSQFWRGFPWKRGFHKLGRTFEFHSNRIATILWRMRSFLCRQQVGDEVRLVLGCTIQPEQSDWMQTGRWMKNGWKQQQTIEWVGGADRPVSWRELRRAGRRVVFAASWEDGRGEERGLPHTRHICKQKNIIRLKKQKIESWLTWPWDWWCSCAVAWRARREEPHLTGLSCRAFGVRVCCRCWILWVWCNSFQTESDLQLFRNFGPAHPHFFQKCRKITPASQVFICKSGQNEDRPWQSEEIVPNGDVQLWWVLDPF